MHARCDEPATRELLTWYLNGTLDGEEQDRVRRHLESCAACGAELDVLSAVALEVSERDLPILAPPERVESARETGWAMGRAWLAGSAFIVMAIAGLAWLALGLPGARDRGASREAPSPPNATGASPARSGDSAGVPTLAQAVEWDLKAIQRGLGPESTFRQPRAGAEMVVIHLPAPVAPDTLFETELSGPDGTLLSGAASRLLLDPLARATFALPAPLLRAPGRYELILRESGAGGGLAREFRFPFRVQAEGEGR